MKVLVIGGLGSIGRRYCAILKHLGVEHEAFDFNMATGELDEIENKSFDKAIVASPTITHYEYCKRLIKMDITFLCEKPLSKSIKQCEELVGLDKNEVGYVVNNYYFMLYRYHKTPILFDYYNTGKDGVYWDCCQLIYINPDIELKTDSPEWRIEEPDKLYTLVELENSYVTMIDNFVKGFTQPLWMLKHGAEMTQAVLDRMKRDEDLSRDSKQK